MIAARFNRTELARELAWYSAAVAAACGAFWYAFFGLPGAGLVYLLSLAAYLGLAVGVVLLTCWLKWRGLWALAPFIVGVLLSPLGVVAAALTACALNTRPGEQCVL